MPMKPLADTRCDEVRRLFVARGGSQYGGEAVTQQEHALQAALFAEREDAAASLIAAALLHDVGHLLHALPADAPEQGVDDRHEALAGRWLERRFGAAVDVAARAARATMTREERRGLFSRHALGLTLLVTMYLAVTIVRSMRADFAPEIWRGLGTTLQPSTFSNSEILVALGVLAVNGMSVFVLDNRRAFFASLAVCAGGFLLIAAALAGNQAQRIDGFTFMVLLGLGLYLPYVAMHTTIFERLLAMTRERGNLGFLMYVADAFGYLGYVGVLVVRNFATTSDDVLPFFVPLCWIATIVSLACLLGSWRYFASRPRVASAEIASVPA